MFPVVKATPFSEALPASLLHATVVDNMLGRRAIQPIPAIIHMILIFVCAGAGILTTIQRAMLRSLLLMGLVVAIYFAAGYVLISQSGLVLPLFGPVIALLGAFAITFTSQQIYNSKVIDRERQRAESDRQAEQAAREKADAAIRVLLDEKSAVETTLADLERDLTPVSYTHLTLPTSG